MIAEDILETLLVNPKNYGVHFIADCPFCGKQAHFYIRKGINRKGAWHGFDCKKCGVNGSEITFLKQIGRLDLLQGRQVNRKLIDLTIGISKTVEEEKEEIPDIKMPMGYKPIKYGDTKNPVYQYLLGRNFQKEDFELYNPGITKLIRKYENYVLIPVENNFSLKGFVGRYILEPGDKGFNEHKERYENSKKTKFAQLIFGLDEISPKTKMGIGIEGIFDKVAVTKHLNLHDSPEIKALCTFGKKVSPYQLSLIRKTGITDFVLLFDSRDAVKEMKAIGYLFKKYFRTRIGYTGVNDPGASSKEEIIQIFENLETVDQFFRSKVQIPNLK